MPTTAFAETPSPLGRFVNEYWTTLAAAGWHGYVRFGRGALLLSASVVAPTTGRERVGWRPAYVVLATVPEVRRLIGLYDPEESIVVLSLPDAAGEGRGVWDDATIERRRLLPGELLEAGVFRFRPCPRDAHFRLAS